MMELSSEEVARRDRERETGTNLTDIAFLL